MQNPYRQIDKTFLSLDNAEERGLIHRDYIAHCFRWSHVVRHLNKGHRYKEAVVLDVGCGKEMPLAKLLYVNRMTPKLYVGVDANRMNVPEILRGKKIQINLWSETDFCALDHSDVGLCFGAPSNGAFPEKAQFADDGRWFTTDGKVLDLPNVTSCFEVLEHVTPEHCRRILQHMLEVTSKDCDYFVSTPCWNGSAAGNHINEMTFGALGSLLEDLSFKILGVWGTFASISDYKSELSNFRYRYNNGPARAIDLTPLFDILSEYYDTNALSTIFAPLFPSVARNCLWHLAKSAKGHARRFAPLIESPTPWSQHDSWLDLKGC